MAKVIQSNKILC